MINISWVVKKHNSKIHSQYLAATGHTGDRGGGNLNPTVFPTREMAQEAKNAFARVWPYDSCCTRATVEESILPVSPDKELALIAFRLGYPYAKEVTNINTYAIKAVSPDLRKGYWLDFKGGFELSVVTFSQNDAQLLCNALTNAGRFVQIEEFNAPVATPEHLAHLFKVLNVTLTKDAIMTSKIYRYAIIETAVNDETPDMIIQDFKTAIAPDAKTLEKRVLMNDASKLMNEPDRIKIVITEITA